jgi:hypothetical protein
VLRDTFTLGRVLPCFLKFCFCRAVAQAKKTRIILSIIAFYFGAKTTVHFSGEARRLNGMYYGLVTFGVSIFSSILIASMAVGSAATSAHALLDAVAANTAWLFVTLILGGIAAAIGGAFSTIRPAVASAAAERATLHPAA